MPQLTNQAKSQLTGLQRVLKRYRRARSRFRQSVRPVAAGRARRSPSPPSACRSAA